MSVHRLRRRRVPKWVWRVALLIVAALWAVVTLSPTFSQAGTEVLVAKRALISGQQAGPDDFEVKRLELGQIASLYAKPTDVGKSMIVMRDTAPGELVANASLRTQAQDAVPIAIQLEQPISQLVTPGAIVDIWASPGRVSDREFAEQIAVGAKVSDLKVRSSMNRVSTTIEVWVKSSFVPAVLLAMADGSVISIVLEPTLGNGH